MRAFKRFLLKLSMFPPAWEAHLEARVPFVKGLTFADREHLRYLIRCFVSERRFEGMEGLEITDEIRVVIAACACRLILSLDLSLYDGLDLIRVYPDTFNAAERGAHGRVQVDASGTTVSLSWAAVLEGLANARDGRNTAYHEFAHVLDCADGSGDGILSATRSDFLPWAALVRRPGFRERVVKSGVLRAYAGENELEFLAVATEVFFERPDLLRKRQPELYEALSELYRRR
ncbi:MAG: M90 family metallopeptidase [Myxococcales bacterium]